MGNTTGANTEARDKTHPRHPILPIGFLMFNLYCLDHRVFVRLFILARLLSVHT
jgi:hypothetical protein